MLNLVEKSYQSRLVHLDPATKFLIAGFPFVVCLTARSLLADLLTLLVMMALTARYGALSRRQYAQLILIPLGFLLMGVATILVQVYPADQTLLLGVKLGNQGIGISQSSLIDALNIFLRAMAGTSCVYFVMLTTPLPDFITLLRRWHCPVILLSLMELVYRYIFVLIEESNRLRTAQACRLGGHNFQSSLRSSGELIGQLFLRTYLRCDRIFAAMTARGYTGELPALSRTYSKRPDMVGAAFLGSVVLMGLAWLEGWLTR